MATKFSGSNSRKVLISLRLSADEYLILKRKARKAHRTVADYIRSGLELQPSNYFWRKPHP